MERINRSAGVNSRCLLPGLLLMIIASLLLFSCAGPQTQKSSAKGVYHIVKKGETAYSIARAYSISLQDLSDINNIQDVSQIKEGQVIFIPDADQIIEDVMVQARKTGDLKEDPASKGKTPHRDLPSKPTEKMPSSEPSGLEAKETQASPAVVKKESPKSEDKAPAPGKKDEVKVEKGILVWPVQGTVKTRFGIQPNKTYHNWIKIVCPAAAKVRAAAAGTVIFSSTLPSYGETIIIRHSNGFATVYTHLKKRDVRSDQNIKKGQVIALAGVVDASGDAFINFEIRLNNKPKDPLIYLP